VFRIRDILVWIRIRIRRSIPLTNGSRRQQKTNLKKKFFCLLLFEGTFTVYHFSKKKSPKMQQNSRNQGFSYYFCLMTEGSGSGSIPLTSGSGPKICGSGSGFGSNTGSNGSQQNKCNEFQKWAFDIVYHRTPHPLPQSP
jgi:hypothetical protein